jgi:hypothetical protein
MGTHDEYAQCIDTRIKIKLKELIGEDNIDKNGLQNVDEGKYESSNTNTNTL